MYNDKTKRYLEEFSYPDGDNKAGHQCVSPLPPIKKYQNHEEVFVYLCICIYNCIYYITYITNAIGYIEANVMMEDEYPLC